MLVLPAVKKPESKFPGIDGDEMQNAFIFGRLDVVKDFDVDCVSISEQLI